METISRVIVSLVYYNSLVRDTLEYTLNKPDGFDTKYYDYKRNGIVNEIKLNTPLKVFLDQNGEKGEDLRKRLEVERGHLVDYENLANESMYNTLTNAIKNNGI